MSYAEEYARALMQARWLRDLKSLLNTQGTRATLTAYAHSNPNFVDVLSRTLTPAEAATLILSS